MSGTHVHVHGGNKIILVYTQVRINSDWIVYNILRNLFIQQFECCGSSDLNDWDINRYFKCGGPSPEECGVPHTCCVRKPEEVWW